MAQITMSQALGRKLPLLVRRGLHPMMTQPCKRLLQSTTSRWAFLVPAFINFTSVLCILSTKPQRHAPTHGTLIKHSCSDGLCFLMRRDWQLQESLASSRWMS